MADDTPTNREFTQLLESIRGLIQVTTELKSEMAVHNAKQDLFEKGVLAKVDDHERILRGEKQGTGIVARVESLETSMKTIDKAAWAFFAPAIGVIFIGLLAAIYLALTRVP